MEEAERATPHREARQEKSNGGASAAFAIRMEYKGEERSTKLPLLDYEEGPISTGSC